ncbi:MAG: hypothetical protein ACJA13_000696 [Paraglaciecola sp.]
MSAFPRVTEFSFKDSFTEKADGHGYKIAVFFNAGVANQGNVTYYIDDVALLNATGTRSPDTSVQAAIFRGLTAASVGGSAIHHTWEVVV